MADIGKEIDKLVTNCNEDEAASKKKKKTKKNKAANQENQELNAKIKEKLNSKSQMINGNVEIEENSKSEPSNEKKLIKDKEDDEEDDVDEQADDKKKKKNKKKKCVRQQSDPPSIKIKEFFVNSQIPAGEIQDHPVPLDGLSTFLNGDQTKPIMKMEKSNNNRTKARKKKTKEEKPKKDEMNGSKNHLITEYYKVTRRKTGKVLKEEQDKEIIYFIENDIDDIKSLGIEEFSDKGRGIVTKKKYAKGSFICEYRGDLIDIQEAKIREKRYEAKELGCYMYYFSWANKQWCIDATEDTGRLGRLINHSRKRPNLKSKLFIFNNLPHLIFVALDNIEEKTELLYDYGETNRTAIEAHPWIKET